GHYARMGRTDDGIPFIREGLDGTKDQSYFLYATTRAQLAALRFPLGGLTKSEVRAHAERLGLATAAKPDSQDICFVPGGDYAAVVRRLRPETDRPGEIVDLDGRPIGHHQGTVDFTVGQRRGLGGGRTEPLYVVAIDADRRRVVAGPRAALAVAIVQLGDTNWLRADLPAEVTVRIRSSAPDVRASLRGDRIEFATPEFGVARGQAAVVYAGSRVLGGGTIVATEHAVAASMN
ncbi:MAG: tRNA 2-thiouridine(34) synthase MnmA, partial [Sphingomonadaceae bacterium]|nr:tRNA 2-thiouridine(34) synthase MnmA [Sphingomonadaceae bacterium]